MTAVWVGFCGLIVALLWLDLAVLNRHSHVQPTSEALRWTAVWVLVALAFSGAVYYLYAAHQFGAGLGQHGATDGWQAWRQYVTGYVVEYSLSLDNVFIMALIFGYFGVPPENQHRTLFWGIIGAMLFRGLMILAGAALVERFDWMIRVFGLVLLYTAVRMLFHNEEQIEPDHNPLIRLARRFYPVSATYDGQRFFTRLADGRRAMTPLCLVLLVIESTDVLFAVDSIPAIFGITRDPFIVFTSNVFAILGLRSLYFVLAGMMARFKYMKPALVFVLLFIAAKMLAPPAWSKSIPEGVELGVIVGILATAVIASLAARERAGGDTNDTDESEPTLLDERTMAELRDEGTTEST